MLGLVLCAFFVLGVITGFSAVGRALAVRVSGLFYSLTGRLPRPAVSSESIEGWLDRQVGRAELGLGVRFSALWRRRVYTRPTGDPIAIVERRDGFYWLFADGELRGPVSPTSTDDLPILSGPGMENARGGELVEFAAVMVRAEAQLSHLVSEMNVDDDGTASLYLDHARTSVIFDLDAVPLEMGRAAEILGRWHDRQQMIAAIDMTTPGEAVVRMTEAAAISGSRAPVSKRSGHPSAPAAAASTTKPRSP
jgi:Cell division protein FtsQ